MKLTELFQQPTKASWDWMYEYDHNSKLLNYEIKTPQGRYYVLTLGFLDEGMWSVSFMLGREGSPGGSTGLTRTGGGATIFGAVADCLRHFVRFMKPTSLIFSAKGSSRQALYDTLAKKMAAELGWVVSKEDLEKEGVMYIVSKPNLKESIENDPDDFDDEDDTRFDHLPGSAVLKQLRPQMATVAQKVYDNWIQDEDDELNGGGICHLIADEIAGIISDAHVPVSTQSASDVQHVYCVAQCNDGVFEVDIPYWLYERGGGYTWTKLPDIRFSPDDVNIYRLDPDPARMHIYVEEWEDDS